MSEQSREAAAWRKGKTPIIAKYSEDHKKLLSAVAGRGFLSLPGYAYDIENTLELATKMNLSELNIKILSETIERELKQTGIDYDQTYKAALLSWEIEKQAVMAAWESELAGIKQGMASDEETLNLLAIETDKRSITVLEQKTSLELQTEAYRKQLADLDGIVSPYEVQLANAKLLTAQKKAEIIPILEEIISKEQTLLGKEQEKAAAYTALIAAENQVTEKKSDLIVPLADLANKSEGLARKIADQITTEGLIADEKIKQLAATKTKAGYQVEEQTANIETETKRLELAEADRDLKDTRFGYSESLISHEKQLTDTYQNEVRSDFNELLEDERAANSRIISDKTTVESIQNATKLTSVNTLATGEMNADGRRTAYEISKDQQIATIQAAAHLTGKLTHLIG